jgi:uncharacterized protein VirK/YbjX
MIFKTVWRMAGHVFARRSQYSTQALIRGILRSLRMVIYYREHRTLFQLDIYRNYLAPVSNSYVLRHLSHRAYLIDRLPSRDRVQCILTHYQFEDASFDERYKRAVYRHGGMTLWQRSVGDSHFAIRLAMSAPGTAEGELTLTLYANAECLHRISFSWVAGSLVGLTCPVVPFVARNQGARSDANDGMAAFDQAFPKNSPRYFCFAAMQGVAQAVGMSEVVGVKSQSQVIFCFTGKHFANAYDVFWRDIGGVELPQYGYRIALPFYTETKATPTSKYGQQAALRRACWGDISTAARETVQRHVVASTVMATA